METVSNSIKALYQIVEPPRITTDETLTKDSYVRSSERFKLINFGQSETIPSGKYNGEEWVTYFQYDPKKVEESVIITSAELYIYYTGRFPEGAELEIREATQPWSEHGLTYLNRPDLGEKMDVEIIVNAEKRRIEMDILKYVQEWVKEDSVNNGFAIVWSGDEEGNIIFRSRESPQPPIVRVEQYDSRILSRKRSEHEFVVEVENHGHIDTEMIVEVDATHKTSHFETEVYAFSRDDVFFSSQDFQVNASRENIEVETFAMYGKESGIEVEVIAVLGPIADDRILELAVSREEMEVEVYVPFESYFETEVVVPSETFSERDAVFAVSREEIDVEVVPMFTSSSSIETVILPQVDNFNDQDFVVNISIEHIDMEVIASFEKDSEIAVDVTPAYPKESHFTTDVIASREDLIFELVVEHDHIEEMDVSFAVSREDVEFHFNIPYNKHEDMLVEMLPLIPRASDTIVTLKVGDKKSSYVFEY